MEGFLRKIPGKLTDAAKTNLRKEAREIFYNAYPKLANHGLEVHHRIPLEWAHLTPDADPNRLSNLIGVDKLIHDQIDIVWGTFRTQSSGLHHSPNAREVLDVAIQVDKIFSTYFNRVLK